MASKHCAGCDQLLPLEAFQKCSTRPCGVQSRCRECRRLAAIEYRARTQERRLAYNREYYAKNADARAKYYESRRDELIEAMRRRRAENVERDRERSRLWHKQNRDRHNELNRNYRARRRGQFVETVVPLVVLERDDGVCGICGGDVDPFDFHVDHKVPISRGGLHSYDNVHVAHPMCNWRKADKTLSEFLEAA